MAIPIRFTESSPVMLVSTQMLGSPFRSLNASSRADTTFLNVIIALASQGFEAETSAETTAGMDFS